jgi:site-specific recombinase XerD
MSNEWDDMIVDSQPGESTALQKQVYEWNPTLDQMIEAWLHEKAGLSGSEGTERMYRQRMMHFRDCLKEAGLDLDSDYRLVATLAQGWAGITTRKDKILAHTFNALITTLSSFYKYAVKHEYLPRNPMDIVERRRGDGGEYAAQPIEMEDIQMKMRTIDRSTFVGLRDYALLRVALSTGRRRMELAGMQMGHLQFSGKKITVTFPRCKGGKRMVNVLTPDAAKALVAYLNIIYPDGYADLPPDAAVWLSISNRSKGQPLTKRALHDIWYRRLGTHKVHTTRHTFAILMEDAGATWGDIGSELGHENIATTNAYMKRVRPHENKFGTKLDKMIGD